MKATMVAAGGLSGGLSSSIAGGKFIDGVRQGLITSGLNHLAHSVVNNIQERDAFSKRFHNVDPQAKPEMNSESVNALLQDVDGLDSFHKAAGSYEIKVSVGKNDVKGLRGYTNNKTISLYEGAFTNNFKLASTMFHEIYHAFQEVFRNGVAYIEAAKYGGQGYFIPGDYDTARGGEKYIEWHAYNFELSLGNTSSYIYEGLNRYKYK